MNTNGPMPDARPASPVEDHAIAIGWACLAAGVVTMFVSLWLFFVYGLLFVGALVFSVVAMSRKRVLAGVFLLLMMVTGPPVLWVMLTAYRGVTAVDHGITVVQKQVARSIEATRGRDERRIAEQAATSAAAHRTDPALGAWAVTMRDEHGEVRQGSDAIGGWERYDEEGVRFSIPVDLDRSCYRIFEIGGGGNRGEWRDEPANGYGGWFEMESRADGKDRREIPFTWGETQGEGGVKRGMFTRSE